LLPIRLSRWKGGPSAGAGNDFINEESGSTSETDTLRLVDLNPADITVSRIGVHVVLRVNATNETVTFDEQFWSAAWYGIDRVEFANGTTWNRTQIQSAAWIRGTTSGETVNGTGEDDPIDADAGNDTINGNGGNDTIIGGAGDDTLNGNAGNDTFVFNAGFGNDTINDFAAGAGAGDVAAFDDSLFADVNAILAASTQVGSDVKITLDASNSVLLKNVTLAALNQDDFLLV
jgi:Ca2+-binding RTX toxin-like protein